MFLLIYFAHFLPFNFSLSPPNICFWARSIDTGAASGAKEDSSVFGAHGSRSRWVHTVGKCANIPRARYERASSMCTGRMQVLSGGFVGGGFPCHLTPPRAPL